MSADGLNAPLARYETMVNAIAECHRVDEVKDIRDKARALEMYARQARDTDAARKASEIRLRAERRAGELLKELAHAGERATPGTNQHDRSSQRATTSSGVKSQAATRPIEPPKTLDQLGISKTQSSRWQALAEVPKEVFEDALRDPVRKPTTAGLIQEIRDPSPRIDRDALRIWGIAREFERNDEGARNPQMLLSQMTQTMQADMARIVPEIRDFFTRFDEVLHELA